MCVYAYVFMYVFIYLLISKNLQISLYIKFLKFGHRNCTFYFYPQQQQQQKIFIFYFGIYSLIFSQQKSLSYILLPLPSHLLPKSTLLLNRCNTCFEINNIFSSFEVDKIVPNWRFTHLCMHDIILALHVFFFFFL